MTEGLGRLSDVTKCAVTMGLDNTYELELEYPVTGERFEELACERIILAKPDMERDPQPFRIYNIQSNDLNYVTVSARHWTHMVQAVPVGPFSASTPQGFMTAVGNNILWQLPFSLTVDQNYSLCAAMDLGSVDYPFAFDSSATVVTANRNEIVYTASKVTSVMLSGTEGIIICATGQENQNATRVCEQLSTSDTLEMASAYTRDDQTVYYTFWTESWPSGVVSATPVVNNGGYTTSLSTPQIANMAWIMVYGESVTENPTRAFVTRKPRMLWDILCGNMTIEGSVDDNDNAESSSLLSVWGGEIEWDKDSIILKSKLGSDNGVYIRYGKNLQSVRSESSSENRYAGVLAYYYRAQSDTVTCVMSKNSEDNSVAYFFGNEYAYGLRRIYMYDATSYFESFNSTNVTGFTLTKSKPKNWDTKWNNYYYLSGDNYEKLDTDSAPEWEKETYYRGSTEVYIPTPQELYDVAVEYASTHRLGDLEVSLNVDFLDLTKVTDYEGREQLEQLSLGDTVWVQYPDMAISTKARVSETTYNVLVEKYESLVVGNSKTTFADSILQLMTSDRNKTVKKIKQEEGPVVEIVEELPPDHADRNVIWIVTGEEE